MQSRVREELVMFMLAREDQVALMRERELLLNVLLAPHMDPKKFSNYSKTVLHSLAQYTKQAQYCMGGVLSREESFASSMAEMIKVWNKLEEDGTLAKWQEELSITNEE